VAEQPATLAEWKTWPEGTFLCDGWILSGRLLKRFWERFSNAVEVTLGWRRACTSGREGSRLALRIKERSRKNRLGVLPPPFSNAFDKGGEWTTRSHGGLGIGTPSRSRGKCESSQGARSRLIDEGSARRNIRHSVPIPHGSRQQQAPTKNALDAPADGAFARETWTSCSRRRGGQRADLLPNSAREAGGACWPLRPQRRARAYRHARPSVLVSDIGMPAWTGTARMSEIRGRTQRRRRRQTSRRFRRYRLLEREDGAQASAAWASKHWPKPNPVEPAQHRLAVVSGRGRILKPRFTG